MKIALLALFVLLNSPVWAAGQSAGGNFKISSANGNFSAQADDSKVCVLRKDSGEMLWSCPSNHSAAGGSYRLLSNSGSTFVFIEKEPSGEGITSIFIYRNGQLKNVIKPGQAALSKLKRAPVLIERENKLLLKLVNVNDQETNIDLNTFQIKVKEGKI